MDVCFSKKEDMRTKKPFESCVHFSPFCFRLEKLAERLIFRLEKLIKLDIALKRLLARNRFRHRDV